MKKTNLRIRNHFVFEEENDYFLSSIDEFNTWKELDEDSFDDFKEKEVTEQLKNLMKKYDIYANVNFYDVDAVSTKTIQIKQDGGK